MIEDLLKKPKSYRKKVAFIATAVLGTMIFSVWVMIASYNIKEAFNATGDDETVASQFKKELPSMRQTDSVMTELEKRGAASVRIRGIENEEDDRTFYEKTFGRVVGE